MPNRLPDPSSGIQPSTLTTTGDILYASSAQVAARLAIGSTNQALGVTGGVPAYQASSKSTLTTTGDIIYASAANTPTRLGIGSTSQVLTVASGIPSWATPSTAAFRGCRVYKSANQSIANSTDTTVTWDLESFDTDGFHDNVTNNNRITIPAGLGGKYLVSINIGWAVNSTGARFHYLYLNALATILDYAGVAPNSGGAQRDVVSTIINLTAGDYLQVQVNQNSGGALNLASNEYYNNFSVVYLGA